MRERLCKVCRKWHEVDSWPRDCYGVAPQAQSDTFPVPYFISDTTEPILHPLDQKYYTSKSTFERITREGGYETVGNDPARLRPRPKPKADIKSIRESVKKATARYNRGERVNLTQPEG